MELKSLFPAFPKVVFPWETAELCGIPRVSQRLRKTGDLAFPKRWDTPEGELEEFPSGKPSLEWDGVGKGNSRQKKTRLAGEG